MGGSKATVRANRWLGTIAAMGIAVCGSGPAAASDDTARATLRDPSGTEVGSVELRDTPAGVLVHADITGLPSGTHAFHIHAVGLCEAPFASAGGHFDPGDRAHGFLDPAGPHAGDLPNIHVPDSGRLEVEMLDARVRLATGDAAILDADGAAIVIHEGPDDYRSDPAGAAGPRIACGVVTRSQDPARK